MSLFSKSPVFSPLFSPDNKWLHFERASTSFLEVSRWFWRRKYQTLHLFWIKTDPWRDNPWVWLTWTKSLVYISLPVSWLPPLMSKWGVLLCALRAACLLTYDTFHATLWLSLHLPYFSLNCKFHIGQDSVYTVHHQNSVLSTLFFFYCCCSSAVVSIFTPLCLSAPTIPASHPWTYPLWLCPCALYACSLMALPLLSLSLLLSGNCQFVLYFNASGCILLALICWLGSTYRWAQYSCYFLFLFRV